MPNLLEPIDLGALRAPNRVLMSPLTRARGTRDHLATPLMATYYAQRASAGLIISEAIGISREGMGWPFATGLWTPQQVEAWRPVVAAVHAQGGRIAAQLWHMGRLVHTSLGGAQPVSASATTAPGNAHTYEGKQPHVPARALTVTDIARVIQDYRLAARNARLAGFDAVELHAANGYLIDQFLRDSSNLRQDEYGGSIDNRMRLLIEVTTAITGEVGAERTAVRLSADGLIQGVDDTNPAALFPAAAAALSRLGIAFLELREASADSGLTSTTPLIRAAFKGPLVLNGAYTLQRATTALQSGQADAISFGRPFISNPDLPHRLAQALPLAADDTRTWYSQGPAGYTDYPAL